MLNFTKSKQFQRLKNQIKCADIRQVFGALSEFATRSGYRIASLRGGALDLKGVAEQIIEIQKVTVKTRGNMSIQGR